MAMEAMEEEKNQGSKEFVFSVAAVLATNLPIKKLLVIPRTLMPREITGETIGEIRAVSDMHQRKAEMARQADAFIALPGGYGTLEELLEVITWAQLGIHRKPEHIPEYDEITSKLIWEEVERLNYMPESDVPT
ncbi:hypothetical protein DH2020_022556 [Rehmannia glutinosa]|uniref:cytokinin riboside 5'-monophosphate phosphoribohydrolase n=1 Tax=Rehmannia glutinosa TaxID=99300 RepID=A0ABR0WFY4_REHGL